MSAKGGALDPYRKTILKIVVKEVLAVLITKLPFLSFGPLGVVASFIIEKILAIALDKTILGVNLAIIEISNDHDVSKLKKALDEAKTIAPTDQAAKDANEKEIIDAARNLITLHDKPRL